LLFLVRLGFLNDGSRAGVAHQRGGRHDRVGVTKTPDVYEDVVGGVARDEGRKGVLRRSAWHHTCAHLIFARDHANGIGNDKCRHLLLDQADVRKWDNKLSSAASYPAALTSVTQPKMFA
jgi:hypothetical protein